MVAHVADAEGAALEFAVAAADHEAALRDPLHDVVAFQGRRQGDRGDGAAARVLGRVYAERCAGVFPQPSHPVVRHGGHRGVTGPARLDGFAGDVLTLHRRGVQQRDRRRAWGLVLVNELLELDQIEIEAARGGLVGLLDIARGCHPEGETGWQRERLLRAREHEVEVPGIGLDAYAAQSGDRVDQHGRVVLMREGGEFRQRRERTGTRLRVHHGDRRVVPLAQRTLDHVERNSLMPVAADHVRVAATGQRDIREALTESAVHHRQDRPRCRAADRGFHESGGGRTRHVHRAGGPEDRTQASLDAGEQRFEDGPPVRQHRGQHRLEDVTPHLGGSGQEERAEVGHGPLPRGR